MAKLNRIKGFTCGIISASTFGLIPLFVVPVLKSGMPINSIMFYRFALSVILFSVLVLIERVNLKVTLKELFTLIWLGALYAATSIILTTSYDMLPSGIATTLHFLYPVLVTLIGILFFHDILRKRTVFAILISLAGVYLLCFGHSQGAISSKGIIWVMVSVITYALYIVGINHSMVAKMDGLKLTFYVLIVSFVIFSVKLFIEHGTPALSHDRGVWINLFLLALIPTVVSDLSLVWAVQNIGATTTAILGCMEPLTATVVGIIFLGEQFEFIQIAGVGAIILAVTLVLLRRHRKGGLAHAT